MGRRRRKKNKYVYIPPKVEYIYNTDYDLAIKDSKIKNGGLGLFSNQDIDMNTNLGEYIGETKKTGAFTCGIYAFNLNNDIIIDAYEYPRTIFAMINDCRFSDFEYNCEFKPMPKDYPERVEIWAIKKISKDDELYCDYGDDYWKYR